MKFWIGVLVLLAVAVLNGVVGIPIYLTAILLAIAAALLVTRTTRRRPE